MKSLLAALGLLVAPCIASAHDAPPSHEQPLGWAYDIGCCSGMDCRPISDDQVKETPSGYLVPNGETIAYKDRKIHESKDGKFHWCTLGGTDTGHTLCLYVPPRNF